MRSIGSYPTDDDLDEMIGVFDRDSDGLINLVEVRACVRRNRRSLPKLLPVHLTRRCRPSTFCVSRIYNCSTCACRRSQFCSLMTRRMDANEDEGVDEMVRAAARKVLAAQLTK